MPPLISQRSLRATVGDVRREMGLQLRLAVRDGAPLVLAVMFPTVGMMLIQYLHRGVLTPDPGIDVDLAVAQFNKQALDNWGPFAPYGAASGVVFALAVVCLAHLAISLATAREEGLLKHVRATPIAGRSYLVAQILVVTIYGVAAAALLLTMSVLTFGVVIYSYQLPGLAVAITLTAMSFACLGVAASNSIIRATTAHTQVYLVLLPMLFLSSVFTSPHMLIADMREVGEWLPMKPSLDSIFHILATDASWPTRAEVSRMVAWGALASIAAFSKFRWLPSQNRER